ncbi:hypothetical protein [Fervidicoccus fontis]|uniref:Cobalt transport protein n=1 Tax=Fervidicoccus fontis TaxID=683846 RepID=A0A2J6N496_9CREN|nr:hypothetical protein [Fervidicoccus fontis]PMB76033.1 MAG: hypothetical protein C0188_00705 [Fervidicoccus fontis]HEW64255.1 hypothetical protein [Fervidicoccus fontis]
MLREIISFLANTIINSIFINPSVPHRRAHIFSKLLFVISIAVPFYERPILGFFFIAEIFLIYLLSAKSFLEPTSMIIISSIPAFWMAISGMIVFALSGTISISWFAEILYKTLFYSLIAMLTVSLITPSDISSILRFFTKKITYPYLLWSLIPYQLKDAVISLKVQELKKSPVSSSVFVVFSEQLERSDQITIANIHRLESNIKRFIYKRESKKFTLFFFILFVINFALMLIFQYINL